MAITIDPAADAAVPPVGPRSDLVRRLLHDRGAVVGAALVLLMVVVAVAAPLLTKIPGQNPHSYHLDALGGDGSPRGSLGGVSGSHWFGVEPLNGRDLFAVVVYGARTALLVGIAATAASMVLGVLIGATAALFGGWVDQVISRVIDVMFGFPSLIFMIALGAYPPAGLPKTALVVAVIGLFGWPPVARLVRGQSLSLMQRNYVVAARAMGAGPWRILRDHLLPNIAGMLIVVTTMTIPANIGYEAALSFLGVGVPPGTPDWGSTISSAIDWVATDPWYLLAPAGALFVVTFGFNLFGDGLRDALDPRLARRR